MKNFSAFLILFVCFIVGRVHATNDTAVPTVKNTAAPTVSPTLGIVEPAVVAIPTISPDETE